MSGAEDRPALGWAVVELMGHRKLGAWVSERQVGDARLVRVDVYREGDDQPHLTQLYGPGAVFCITPVEERVARLLADRLTPELPLSRYDIEWLGRRRDGATEPPDDDPFEEEDPEVFRVAGAGEGA